MIEATKLANPTIFLVLAPVLLASSGISTLVASPAVKRRVTDTDGLPSLNTKIIQLPGGANAPLFGNVTYNELFLVARTSSWINL